MRTSLLAGFSIMMPLEMLCRTPLEAIHVPTIPVEYLGVVDYNHPAPSFEIAYASNGSSRKLTQYHFDT